MADHARDGVDPVDETVFTNSIADTPLDPEVEKLRWEKPVTRERRAA